MSFSPSLLSVFSGSWDFMGQALERDQRIHDLWYCVHNDIMEDHQRDKFHHWNFSD